MEENKNTLPYEDAEPFILNHLKDSEHAAGFLNEALEDYIYDGDYTCLAGAIKEVLKAHNISAIARETDVSNRHLYRIVNGTSKPTFDLLVKIFKYLGYKIELIPIDKTA